MSGLNIVLDTQFNNTLLPTIPVIGFFDNFNRADGPVGVTSGEAKTWQAIAIAGTPGAFGLNVVSNTAQVTGTSGSNLTVVDALAADGTITARFTALSTDGGCRIAARSVDYNNTILYHVNNTAGAETVKVEKRVAGVSTTLGTSAAQGSLVNRNIQLVLAGNQVTAKVDGVTVLGPYTVTDLTGNTKHGLFVNAGLSKAWACDEIGFAA